MLYIKKLCLAYFDWKLLFRNISSAFIYIAASPWIHFFPPIFIERNINNQEIHNPNLDTITIYMTYTYVIFYEH